MNLTGDWKVARTRTLESVRYGEDSRDYLRLYGSFNLDGPLAFGGAEGAGEFGRAGEAEADLAGNGFGQRDQVAGFHFGKLTGGDFDIRHFSGDLKLDFVEN